MEDTNLKIFIKDAKARGLTKDQAWAEYSKTKTGATTTNASPEVLSGVEKMKQINATEQDPIRQYGQGAVINRYRNIEEPKSGIQSGLETAGNVAETALLTGGGILGSLMGGKSGSATLTGAVKAGTSTIREAYQNITGRQDQLPSEAAVQPIKDAATAAAADYVISSFFEIPGAIKKRIGQAAVGEIVADSGQKNLENSLLRHKFDPKEELIGRGILTDEWEKPLKNSKFPYKGREILGNQLDVAEKEIQNIVKSAKVAKLPIMNKKSAMDIMKANAQGVAEDTGRPVEEVIAAGKRIIDETFDSNILTAEGALNAKRALFNKTLTAKGVPYTGMEKQVKYRLAMAINSNLKDAVPAIKPGLREEEILLNLRDMLDTAFIKSYKDNAKSLAIGMSASELDNVANKVWQSSFAFSYNPIAGAVVSGMSAPSILSKMFGNAKIARAALKDYVPEGVSKVAMGSGKFIQALGLTNLGK